MLGVLGRDGHTYLRGGLHGGLAAVKSLMRTLLSASVASLLVTGLVAGSVFAGKPINQKDNKQASEQTVFVTGSLIPKRVKLKRIGTTTVSPLRIIERREIDETGRQTTAGALIADPSVRIMGR
jgi:hypothetical protein